MTDRIDIRLCHYCGAYKKHELFPAKGNQCKACIRQREAPMRAMFRTPAGKPTKRRATSRRLA